MSAEKPITEGFVKQTMAGLWEELRSLAIVVNEMKDDIAELKTRLAVFESLAKVAKATTDAHGTKLASLEGEIRLLQINGATRKGRDKVVIGAAVLGASLGTGLIVAYVSHLLSKGGP